MNLVIKDEQGKVQFLGKEDPNNPPNNPHEGSKMECPQCHEMFDYLVGENTSDGGRQGCEGCYKPSQKPKPSNESYDTTQEML